MNNTLKKMFAGVSAAAIMLTQVGTAIAMYSDVPEGAWYKSAVDSFVEAKYLDGAQTRFRGTDNANRAEFIKLVVEISGGVLDQTPAVPSFDDVSTGAWYYKYFEAAGQEGWVRGDGSCYGKHPCYARPNANINRAEAAAIIVRAFGLQSTGAAAQFVDNPSGKWYTADVQTAADHCILQGDDSTGRVRPNDNMNRAEMVVMLAREEQGLTYGKDCGTTSVTTPMVKEATATSATVVEVDFNVAVDATVAADKSHYSVTGSPEIPVDGVKVIDKDTVEVWLTKAQDAGHVYTLAVTDMQTADGVKFSDSKTFSGYTTVVQGDGSLEATLSAKNPMGDTVPKGAQGVVFTSVDLTATGDAVTLENVTILHEGFGQSSDFSGVYAVVDGARVTRKRTIDSQSYTSTLRFTTPLTIAAGKTVTLQIAGDLTTSATASAEHTLSVELPTDIISNAKSVKGNFPLKGKVFRVAAVSSGTVSVAYRSVTPSNIKVGDKAATIGKWEINADSVEDQTIYSMTIENDGTASDGDFTNIAIRRSDGTVLTKTVATTVGDFATLVFDPPFTILEGDRITMNVIADIKGGAAKTMKIHFDETGDIFAVGSLYGYGVNAQLYGSSIALPTDTSSTVTIDAGQFTISIDGPTTQQFTRKDKNAVLANVWFETGGEDVDVEELYALIQGSTSTGTSFSGRPASANEIYEGLEKVELRNTTTGRTISGVRLTGSTDSGNAATGTYQVYRFDDFIVHGKEKYEFRVNFIDNSGTSATATPANGDRFRVHLCGEATHKLDSSNNLVTNTTSYCTLGGFYTGGSTSNGYLMKIKGVSTSDRIGDYRPGGTITGTNQEIKTASLTITGKATASTDTTVKNAKNVSLLRFESRASEATDILMTDFIFTAAVGADTASGRQAILINAQNYTLWVDTNDDGVVDTILQKGAAAQSGQITFDKLTGGGYVVPKQKAIIFEVHADISSSFNSETTLSLRFDSGATAVVQAEQVVDGSALSGVGVKNGAGVYATTGSAGSAASEIQLIAATATTYTLRSQGDLYVTKATTPVKSRQLLGGTLSDELLRLQFHAEYEDIDVTDIVLTGSGTNAATTATNVDRLELYKVGATTPFAVATVAGCGTDTVPAYSMCAKLKNQEFIVPKGSDTNVLVRARMRTDVDGATSGQYVSVYIAPTHSISSTSSGSIRARGLLSSNDLTGMDTDGTAEGEIYVGTSAATATAGAKIEGNQNQVVLSKITSITSVDPNANGTAIPTGSKKALGQFKFATAAANNTKNGANKFTLSGVIFTVNATNVTVDSATYKLYNKADPTATSAACTVDSTSGSSSLLVSCDHIGGVNTQIEPGSDATFVLEATVLNAKVTNTATSTLQVSLSNFDTRSASTFGTSSGNSRLKWFDKDNSTTTTFLWIEYPETSVNGTSYNG